MNDDSRDDPRRVGESLDRLTRSLGGPDAAVLAPLFGRWPELVGEQVAAHARPVTLTDGSVSNLMAHNLWQLLPNGLFRRIYRQVKLSGQN